MLMYDLCMLASGDAGCLGSKAAACKPKRMIVFNLPNASYCSMCLS